MTEAICHFRSKSTPSQLRNNFDDLSQFGDVPAFDRGIFKVPVAIRGSRCLPLYPSSVFIIADEAYNKAAFRGLFGAPALAVA